jgi:hypothetical protein
MRDIILQLRHDLKNAFADVMKWFDCDANLAVYSPRSGGWTIQQILEHISLTNHYLLILIKKGTGKALKLAVKKEEWLPPADYQLDWEKLKAIGRPGTFYWNRPDHMEPSGQVKSYEINETLSVQLKDCLEILDKLANGEGVLYKIMMSVNDIGKIDVYHYILFLAQHARRHVAQMQQIKMEFDAVKN